jgi:hypothetical protein
MHFSAADVRQYTEYEKMLNIIFEKSKVYREIGHAILQEFKAKGDNGSAQDAGLTSREMSLLSKRFSKSTFYKVINEVLLPLGIIERNPRTHRYYLSPEFPNALRRLSEYWKKWLREPVSTPLFSGASSAPESSA